MAKEIFEKTLNMLPDYKDGPSNTLLEVIEDNHGVAPASWKGFRELTEKWLCNLVYNVALYKSLNKYTYYKIVLYISLFIKIVVWNYTVNKTN